MRIEHIGLATLYLGDCREVLPEITVTSDTTVITDPPYSSGGFQEAGKSGGSIGTRSDEVIALDNLSTRGYQRLMREVLRHLNIADEAYIFTDWRMWVYTADAADRCLETRRSAGVGGPLADTLHKDVSVRSGRPSCS